MPKPENVKPHEWKKGQSGNPNGRPRKTFKSINKQLQEDGFEKLSKSDLIDAYALVFNSTEKELKKIATDQDAPYALRLIIKELNSEKTRSRALQDYRDYMFGKAKENTDITSNGESINILPIEWVE